MVLIGGGVITWEVAAAIVAHYPDMPLVMIMAGETVLEQTGFGPEICQFYERRLARVSSACVMGGML